MESAISPAGRASTFRSAMRRVPTSVVVVAGLDDGEPIGMVVGTFTAVSLDPPLVGFLGDGRSTTFAPLLEIGRWSFSVLPECEARIAGEFRRPRVERFLGIDWRATRHGTPEIEGSLLTVHAERFDVLPAGDHTFVLASVLDFDTRGMTARPLLYFDRRFVRLDPHDLARADIWQVGWDD